MRDSSKGSSAPSQGLAQGRLDSESRLATIRSKTKSREISERKQVGDAESMINEEPAIMHPGQGSEWLDEAK